MRLYRESIYSRSPRTQGTYISFTCLEIAPGVAWIPRWCFYLFIYFPFASLYACVTNLKRHYHELLTRLCWQVTPSSGSVTNKADLQLYCMGRGLILRFVLFNLFFFFRFQPPSSQMAGRPLLLSKLLPNRRGGYTFKIISGIY